MNGHSKQLDDDKKRSAYSQNVRNRVQSLVQSLKKNGVHSPCYLAASGFEYTGEGDTTQCKDCGLVISNWTLDMNPFTIHNQNRPDCRFVRSILASTKSSIRDTSSSQNVTDEDQVIAHEYESPTKRRKTEVSSSTANSNTLNETDLLQHVRIRTFSHWSNINSSLAYDMIHAGFFGCNIADRVICIYCNLICHQWDSDTDDPCEVHKTLSPNCPYVKDKLVCPSVSRIHATNHRSTESNHRLKIPCHTDFSEISKRYASFNDWQDKDSLSIDDFVRAGFFYTATSTYVTCFYCNGSLKNFNLNTNPIIEHVRLYPQCAYAKQVSGDNLYNKIQQFEQARKERSITHVSLNEKTSSSNVAHNNLTTDNDKLLKYDETTLSKLVAIQLDSPTTQLLLAQNCKLSVIKRCWEDQLRLKGENFISDYDLSVACLILQKQIEHIDGKKENIVIPNVKMRQIRNEREIQGDRQQILTTNSSNRDQSIFTETPDNMECDMDTPLQSNLIDNQSISAIVEENNSQDSLAANTCMICLISEKRLACIPCGHLISCVPCGQSLQSCPICYQSIKSYVKIYV